MPGFRTCPKPALGLEAAALGTNIPPVLAGGAAGRARPKPPGVSSDNCKVFPLKTIGSVRSSSLPASYRQDICVSTSILRGWDGHLLQRFRAL